MDKFFAYVIDNFQEVTTMVVEVWKDDGLIFKRLRLVGINQGAFLQALDSREGDSRFNPQKTNPQATEVYFALQAIYRADFQVFIQKACKAQGFVLKEENINA